MPTAKLPKILYALAGALVPVSVIAYLASGETKALIWGTTAAIFVALSATTLHRRALLPFLGIRSEKRPLEQFAPEDCLSLSIQAWERKDYERSKKYAQSGLARNPQKPQTKAGLFHRVGLVHQHFKKYPEATAAFETAIDLDPKFSAPHNNLGIIHYDQRRYPEAEKEFKKAIALDPLFPWPHNNLGNYYFAHRRFAEAETEYKEALRLDPDYPDARHNLKTLQKMTRKTQ